MLRENSIIHKESDKVLFVYVGSLAPAIRSPEFFLKVFSNIPEKEWRLLFIGDATCTLLNDYAKEDSRITVIGRCTHEQALQYESQASILLNLGNRNANLTPSKVFEYMSFCKKIVTTYPIENEPSLAYLKKYPAVLLLDERSNIEEAANALQDFVKEQKPFFQYSILNEMYYANTPEAFIRRVIDKPTN